MQRRQDSNRIRSTYSSFYRPYHSLVRQCPSLFSRQTAVSRHHGRHRSSSTMRRSRSRSGSNGSPSNRRSSRHSHREAATSTSSGYSPPGKQSNHRVHTGHSPCSHPAMDHDKTPTASTHFDKSGSHMSAASLTINTQPTEVGRDVAAVADDTQQPTATKETVSHTTKRYQCTTCNRTLTSASGWYKHRRFYHRLATPRQVSHTHATTSILGKMDSNSVTVASQHSPVPQATTSL